MTARYIVSLLLVAVTVSGWAQSQDRFSLTAQQVARALSEGGMPLEGKRVSLVANVVAAVPNPKLDIQTVEPFGDPSPGEYPGAQSWVRVDCHEQGICLPFFAVVSWPVQPVRGASGGLNAPVAAIKPASRANVAITIRAGMHATLVMDDDRSHIQIAVISLENGMTGHTIRVASADHRQVYAAEVVSAQLLRRSF